MAFVHLTDDGGRIVAQSDAVPAGGYNTDRWLTDEVVVDPHELTPVEPLPPGRYRLVAGLYDPSTGQRLSARDDQLAPYAGDAVPLGEVVVP